MRLPGRSVCMISGLPTMTSVRADWRLEASRSTVWPSIRCCLRSLRRPRSWSSSAFRSICASCRTIRRLTWLFRSPINRLPPLGVPERLCGPEPLLRPRATRKRHRTRDLCEQWLRAALRIQRHIGQCHGVRAINGWAHDHREPVGRTRPVHRKRSGRDRVGRNHTQMSCVRQIASVT